MFKWFNIPRIVNLLMRRNYNQSLQRIYISFLNSKTCNYMHFRSYGRNPFLINRHLQIKSYFCLSRTKILGLSILGWLGFADDEKESELIITLKRAILSTQREEYDKAEQILHIALRLAQQQQNQQGILYCYDLMANLALTQLQLEKAEKLFITVMQTLLKTGVEQDDLKIIHVSLKLARICHLRAEEERAELGYQWCLEKIEKHKNSNIDSQTLYGVIQDWYAQYLLDKGEVQMSLIHLKEAYKVCCELNGKKDAQSMLLLNDLGITCWRAGDLQNAEKFLTQAVDIGKTMEDQTHVGVFLANLGLIYLQKGLNDVALKYCKDAWKLGRKFNSKETMEQANYCFEQITSNT